MLATPSPFSFYTPHAFTPTRPSPLAERHINIATHASSPPPPPSFTFSMSAPDKKSQSQTQSRAYRPNPVVQTRDAATQKRRDLFFRRVQRGREDKKWEGRGDQIQRLDYLSEHKRWEAEKARQAPEVEEEGLEREVEEVMGFASSSSAAEGEVSGYVVNGTSSQPLPEREMQEAEYMNEREEWELQQLIASMEEEENRGDNASQHYGSDDEDYDLIFMDCAATAEQGDFSMQDVDAMDMS